MQYHKVNHEFWSQGRSFRNNAPVPGVIQGLPSKTLTIQRTRQNHSFQYTKMLSQELLTSKVFIIVRAPVVTKDNRLPFQEAITVSL